MDGYKRLAAAVIGKALKDLKDWDEAQTVAPKDTRCCSARERRLMQIRDSYPPREFLTRNTPFHAILNLSPKTVKEHLDQPGWLEKSVKYMQLVERTWNPCWNERLTSNPFD